MKKGFTQSMFLFAKFKVLTVDDLRLLLGTPSSAKTRCYEILRELVAKDWVSRISHPRKPLFAYCATPLLLGEIYGDQEATQFATPKLSEFSHLIACSQVMTHLTCRDRISGIAFEHELDLASLARFCFNRRPDGIAEVTSREGKYEMAIEVETTLKASHRIEDIISSYEKTFISSEFRCAGAVIVTVSDATRQQYLEQISTRPSDVRERFIVSSETTLSDVSEKFFGNALAHSELNPNLPQYSTRTEFGRETKYFNEYQDFKLAKAPNQRGQSAEQVRKDKLYE